MKTFAFLTLFSLLYGCTTYYVDSTYPGGPRTIVQTFDPGPAIVTGHAILGLAEHYEDYRWRHDSRNGRYYYHAAPVWRHGHYRSCPRSRYYGYGAPIYYE